MKIVNEQQRGIPTCEMKDGDIGIIIQWGENIKSESIGVIVQRYEDELIAIGKDRGESYSIIPNGKEFRVRILPKGTLLEI